MRLDFLKKSLFIRIFSSYVMILLIPLTLGIVTYNESIRIIEKDSREASMSILQQSTLIMDRNMAEIDQVLNQLSTNADVLNLLDLYSPFDDKKTTSDIFLMQRQLGPYGALNGFITMFYIYSDRGDFILSPYTSYIRMDQFYQYFLTYEGYDFAAWKKQFLEPTQFHDVYPVMPVTMGNKQFEALTYVTTIQRATGTKRGGIIVLVDEQNIRKLLGNAVQQFGGFAYVSDPKGRILASFASDGYTALPADVPGTEFEGNFDQVIDGQRMLITYRISTYNNWTYVSAIPISAVMERVSSIKTIITIILGLSILLGIAVSLLLAYRNSKPITDLVKAIRESSGTMSTPASEDIDAYSFLKETFADYEKKNRTLRDDLEHQTPLLRTTILTRLFNGEYDSLETAESAMKNVGIPFSPPRYAVLLLAITDYNQSNTTDALDELNMAKVLVKREISERFCLDHFLYDVDFDRIAILVPVKDQPVPEAMAAVNDCAAAIREDLRLSFTVQVTFAGSLAGDILGLGQAYFEARQAMLYKTPTRNSVVTWYRDRPATDDHGFYYPINVELKLLELVRSHGAEELQRLLTDIYRRNFQVRRVATAMSRQLIASLQGTMIRLSDSLEGDKTPLMRRIMEVAEGDHPDFEQVFRTIGEIFAEICERLHEKTKSVSDAQIQDMLSYLDMNFADHNICLSSVATKYNLTEAYLSRYFKEHTGENFSKYVERIRMEKARSLLRDEKVPVLEVAEMVGYNSPHVFRRAFKRYFGRNPSEG